MRRSLLAMLATTTVASAGTRTTVAIAAVDLGRDVAPYLRPTLTTQLANGLAAAGYEVKPVGLRGELATCRDDSCVAEVGKALGVDQVVFASITKVGESRVIDMRLYSASGGRLAELHEVCDLCGESELVERVGLSASALRARAAEPLSIAPARSKVPGIIAVAAGTVILGGSIALVALDGRGTCSAGDAPVYPDAGAVIRYPDPMNHTNYICRDVYETKGIGLGAMVFGVASIAVGVALLVRARHHETVQVAPAPGGATIGMTFTW
ncbi:hypothetical protein BH11MYX1_BH11MYX1_12840 [soil metagenome]